MKGVNADDIVRSCRTDLRFVLPLQLQELRGNIRVFCRCRLDNRVECCLKFVSNEDILAPGAAGSKKQFRFDKIYSPTSTQAEVWTLFLIWLYFLSFQRKINTFL